LRIVLSRFILRGKGELKREIEMKNIALAVFVASLAIVSTAGAQTCQVIGNMKYCQPSGGNPYAIGGGYTQQQIGNMTYYNYNKPQAAQRQGLPQSSQQIGNIKYYDNGITRQSIGNIDYYSNGITRQRIGNIDYYSNGKTCQQIGTMSYCN
jgi:hypothetical protein